MAYGVVTIYFTVIAQVSTKYTRLVSAIYTVSQKSSHLLTVCNFSNLNRFSKFLHGWKAYEICYKAHMTLPNPP